MRLSSALISATIKVVLLGLVVSEQDITPEQASNRAKTLSVGYVSSAFTSELPVLGIFQ